MPLTWLPSPLVRLTLRGHPLILRRQKSITKPISLHMHLYPLEESEGFFNCFTAATSRDPDNWSSRREATVDADRFDSILKGIERRIAEKGKARDFDCID